MKLEILLLCLNYIKLSTSLTCLKCSGCSTNDISSSETCTEQNSDCFIGLQFGYVYQGCTSLSAFQLASFYSNVKLCSTDNCNKNSQSTYENTLTCYYCSGCLSSNAVALKCPNLSYSCYSGLMSGLIYQGCTTSNYNQLAATYSNLQVCSNSYCNGYDQANYAPKSCFSCRGCSMNSVNTNTEQCADNTYNCFLATLNGALYQGCTKDSNDLMALNYQSFQTCSSSMCNSNSVNQISLTCYSCYGCMNFDANKRTETCKDSSYRCFFSTDQGVINQGCTQSNEASLALAYKNVKSCNRNMCNVFIDSINGCEFKN